MHYDIPVVGYKEKWKITKLVIRNYWWLGIIKDIRRYIEEYNIYQRMKNKMEVLVEKLKLSKVPKKPWYQTCKVWT